MGKKRSRQQRGGRKGEDVFEVWAGDHRLLTSRPRDDFGFDFLCEVEDSSTGTSEITGDFVVVSVRSTTARARRVELKRDDADRLLGSKAVAFVALVALGGDRNEVFHRFVDEAFAVELAELLASDRKSLTLTPAKCHHSKAFDRNLEVALRGHSPERIRLHVAKHLLRKDMPSLHLEVRRTESGELTLVDAPNFYDYFIDGNAPPEQGPHYEAIFGSPRLRYDRLAELGPRTSVTTHLKALPTPLLQGEVTESVFRCVAEGEHGRGVTQFSRVYTKPYTGWVHEGGFSITISASKQKGDHWVHEIDALIDDDEELFLPDHPDLWRFLACCTPDAAIYPEDDARFRLGVEWIAGMHRAHFFARCLREAMRTDGWDSLQIPLKVSKDDESMHTIALSAEAETGFGFLNGFGFVISPADEHSEKVDATAEIPIIGNLGSTAVVVWVAAEITQFVLNDVVRGFRIDEVISARVEPHDRVDKASPNPEMVIEPTWPTFAFTQKGVEQVASDALSWGIEMRVEGNAQGV